MKVGNRTSNRNFLHIGFSGVNVYLDRCGSRSTTTWDAKRSGWRHWWKCALIVDDDTTCMNNIGLNLWNSGMRLRKWMRRVEHQLTCCIYGLGIDRYQRSGFWQSLEPSTFVPDQGLDFYVAYSVKGEMDVSSTYIDVDVIPLNIEGSSPSGRPLKSSWEHASCLRYSTAGTRFSKDDKEKWRVHEMRLEFCFRH